MTLFFVLDTSSLDMKACTVSLYSAPCAEQWKQEFAATKLNPPPQPIKFAGGINSLGYFDHAVQVSDQRTAGNLSKTLGSIQSCINPTIS
jgi:hypothetical protein